MKDSPTGVARIETAWKFRTFKLKQTDRNDEAPHVGAEMEETEQTLLSEDDADATMITPRFDEGETITAQPVVPLAVVSPDATNYATPPTALKGGARRSWPLALVLMSALAGSALGVAGLYFYQQRQSPDDAVSETPQSASVANDAAQSSTTPVPERPVEMAIPSPTPARAEHPAPAVVHVMNDNNEMRAENARDEKDAKKKKDNASAPRKAVETEEHAGTIKHGKKGERAENGDEAAQPPQRPRRVETASDAEQTARRIGTIIYPENRRAPQTRARQRSIDRVRGIFEGQPPR